MWKHHEPLERGDKPHWIYDLSLLRLVVDQEADGSYSAAVIAESEEVCTKEGIATLLCAQETAREMARAYLADLIRQVEGRPAIRQLCALNGRLYGLTDEGTVLEVPAGAIGTYK